MRKEYITFLPVCSDRTADMLKTEAIWTVLECIRRSGMRGKTVAEIQDETTEPRSTVYNAIKQLEREGYIQGMKEKRLKKIGRMLGSKELKKRGIAEDIYKRKYEKKSGKRPKVYFEACELRAGITHRHEGERENPWGDVVFSEDFFNVVGRMLKKDKGLSEINNDIIKLIKDFYTKKIETSDASEVKKLIPEDEICELCKKSHEGYEFLKALVLFIASNLLESKEFEKLLEELKFR